MIYNIEANTWLIPEVTGDIPPKTTSRAVAKVEKDGKSQMLVFGGSGSYGFIYAFILETMEW